MKKIASSHFQKTFFLEKKGTYLKNYLTDTGPTQARKVDSSSITFDKYLKVYYMTNQKKT